MSLAKKVASNTLVQFIGKGLTMALTAVAVSFTTRYLGPEKFGFYTIALTILSFVSLFADLGAYGTAVRDLSLVDDEAKFKEKFSVIFSFRFFVSLIVHLLSVAIVVFTPVDPILKIAFSILALSGFLSSLNQTFVSVLHMRYKMAWAVLGEIANKAIVSALILAVYFLRFDYTLIFWAAVIGMAVNLFLVVFATRKNVHVRLSSSLFEVKRFAQDSVLLGIGGLIGTFHFRMDTVFLSFMHEPFDVGIYGIAYRIFEIATLLPGMFTGMMIPSVSQSQNNLRRFNELSQKSFNLLSMIVFPTMTIVGWSAPYLISLFGGKMYEHAILPLEILTLAFFPLYLSSIFGTVFLAAKRLALMLSLGVIILVINIPIVFVLVWKFSFVGAAISTVIAEFIALVVLFTGSKIKMKLNLKFNILKKMFGPLIVANITAGAFWFSLSDFEKNLLNNILLLSVFAIIILGIFAIYLLKSKLLSFDKERFIVVAE